LIIYTKCFKANLFFLKPSTFQVIAVNSTETIGDDDKDFESDNEGEGLVVVASTTRVDLSVAGSLTTGDLKGCQAQLHHLMIKIHHSDLVQ
jgi:hypothetical protein